MGATNDTSDDRRALTGCTSRLNCTVAEDEQEGSQARLTSRVVANILNASTWESGPGGIRAVEEKISRRMEALDFQPQALGGTTAVVALLGILSLIVSQDEIRSALVVMLTTLAPGQPSPGIVVTGILLTAFCLGFTLFARVFLGSYRELRILEIMREVCDKLEPNPRTPVPTTTSNLTVHITPLSTTEATTWWEGLIKRQ